MPITVYPCTTPLERVDTARQNPRSAEELIAQPFDILPNNKDLQKLRDNDVFKASFPSSDQNSTSLKDNILAAQHGNGLVNTMLRAYNNHHHLVLRPDDIWIAILTQFNFFVNANAEPLRHLFVEHKEEDGKKELVIECGGTRFTMPVGPIVVAMGKLIQENIVDPGLREWIMPRFSTTTPDDTIIESVIMMSTLQNYFTYLIRLRCGLPAVTLLGERQDWEMILQRIEKLNEYGSETSLWKDLLRQVILGFLETFDAPLSDKTLEFWNKIAHVNSGGSGPSFLSGWITAFCFFDNQGQSLYDRGLNVGRFGNLILGEDNEVVFHLVDTNNIPGSYATVPVTVDDNGEIVYTVMVAGLVGTRISGVQKDTVQPQSAWWIAEDKNAPAK